MTTLARAEVVMLLATLFNGQQANAQQMPVPKSINDLVTWVRSHNKAPFDRDSAQMPTRTLASLKAIPLAASAAAKFKNVKVNQDRNPWPKAEVGSAVDPITGKNYVVMTNDFRENWDHEFYHVSTNGGKAWTDDSMVGGFDPYTGGAPLTFQSDPGVALDSVGHSVLSAITGNNIFDFTNVYENLDSEIEVAVGYGNGIYTSLLPTVVDFQPCNFSVLASTCAIQLDKPLVTIDNVPGSPNNGTVYVYYTAFCVQFTPCFDGNATIPPFSSAILESHAAGAGLPFGPPNLVSGQFTQEQFSDIVVDSHGVAHAFFDDFSTGVNISMYMSTFNGSSWVANLTPIATFVPIGVASPNWVFRISGTIAPGCGIHGDTAYCAFSSNQVGNGPTESGMSVYLATVNTGTGASTIARVNNDPFNDGKDHIFPWATAIDDHTVYVGWYDDRNDPFNTLAQYFVGKSTDGGKTFPKQLAVNDVPFNPCVGFPGCGFFGDYTQLVSGPDELVHAAWSDTRDGASMQVWSQTISW